MNLQLAGSLQGREFGTLYIYIYINTYILMYLFIYFFIDDLLKDIGGQKAPQSIFRTSKIKAWIKP